jgi:hypothetical protein
MLNCPVDLIFRDCRLRLFFNAQLPGLKASCIAKKPKAAGVFGVAGRILQWQR